MTADNLKKELAELLIEKEQRVKYNKFDTLFPTDGPYRRALYPKHIDFMTAGFDHRQRAIIAANRTGKTLMGAYEMTCHLTGKYPEWWKGKKFDFPISAWAASIRNSDTKDIIQFELFGDPVDFGSGMIPKDDLGKRTMKAGIADAIDTAYIKHYTDGVYDGFSKIGLKSYEQGRDGFQGTKKQVIWLDEEPRDYSIFTECLTRTMDDKAPGMIYCTFTPLYGLSDTVMSFLPDGKFPEGNEPPDEPHKYVSQVSWEEVPHLSEDQKKEILSSYSAHEREARSRGIPSLGAGAIYPYLEDDLVCEPFEIPMWWPRAYGMDVGWNRTAVVWGAMDPDTRQIYLYSEHYQGQAHPAVHASAIKARGEWIRGVIDPRSDARSQTDGTRLIDLYMEEGLDLDVADNSVEAGLYKVGQMLESGQLKIFNTLRNWLSEYRIYRRDENGKIIKKNDHLMDSTRYLCMSGIRLMQTMPDPDMQEQNFNTDLDRSSVTGY
jgi:phage terminase large subunit-like protein